MLERLKRLKAEVPYGRWNEFLRGTVSAGIPAKKDLAFCKPGVQRACVTVCAGGCKGCVELKEALEAELARIGAPIEVGLAKTGCSGKCGFGPFLGFPQKLFFYTNVSPDDVPMIVEETLVNGKVLLEFLSISPDRSYRPDVLFERETGCIAAIDETVSMVDVAKYFLAMEKDLSCGKCIPCRQGFPRLNEIMDKIAAGNGTAKDLDAVVELCQLMKLGAYCEFATASSRPVLSAIKYFEDEFKALIKSE